MALEKFFTHFLPATHLARLMPREAQTSRARMDRFLTERYMWFLTKKEQLLANMSSTTRGMAVGAPLLEFALWVPLSTRCSLLRSTP